MCWFLLFINFFIIYVIKTALLESDISGTQKPTLPRVFDLQGWDQVHFEEECTVYPKVSLTNIFSDIYF